MRVLVNIKGYCITIACFRCTIVYLFGLSLPSLLNRLYYSFLAQPTELFGQTFGLNLCERLRVSSNDSLACPRYSLCVSGVPDGPSEASAYHSTTQIEQRLTGVCRWLGHEQG